MQDDGTVLAVRCCADECGATRTGRCWQERLAAEAASESIGEYRRRRDGTAEAEAAHVAAQRAAAASAKAEAAEQLAAAAAERAKAKAAAEEERAKVKAAAEMEKAKEKAAAEDKANLAEKAKVEGERLAAAASAAEVAAAAAAAVKSATEAAAAPVAEEAAAEAGGDRGEGSSRHYWHLLHDIVHSPLNLGRCLRRNTERMSAD